MADRTEPLVGLSSVEAAARLSAFGPNELPKPKRRSVLAIALECLREPMSLLMLAAAALYLLLGDVGEGLFLVAAAAVSVGLVIAQEARSERALAALRDLAQPHVRVLRDGVQGHIPAGQLVPGDLMLLAEGERIAADGRLVAGDMLGVDESALTGESAPAAKRLAISEEQDREPVGEDLSPWLFAGTLIVSGQGIAEVVRTGPASALGRIGASLAGIASEPTPLQRTAGRLVRLLGAGAIGFCVLITVAYGLVRRDWVEGALAGITAAIALAPEEFPMVLAVFMALGAWRLAAHRVLVRRGAVIDALGAATVLCVDKTGTITENRMRLTRLWTPAQRWDAGVDPAPSGELKSLVQTSALASAVHASDPMDKAVHALAETLGLAEAVPPSGPDASWPIRPERLAIVQLWRAGPGWLLAAKGAPEAIVRLCRLGPAEATSLVAEVHRLAAEGCRVLAVAKARVDGAAPEQPEAAIFALSGLLGFVDPVRPDAPQAVAEARGAGIEVMMITGDHPATAGAIARAAGLSVELGVITGQEIAALPFPILAERLRSVRVCARVAPDQKLRVVEALTADGQVVAMTGDGVNDAPALQAAHVGIAMGGRGTDVAREAADVILLDDNFASIVAGVRLGRRIFANLRRALVYITAIHVPIAGLALLPILLGLPPVLFPMHVVLLELAIDPICALAFEGEPSEADAMRRPPRPRDEPLFGLPQLALAAAQGSALLGGLIGLYVWALGHGSEPVARGAVFTALVLGNLGLALADATSRGGRLLAPHRRIYWLIAGAAVLLLVIVLLAPAAARMFEVARPPAMLLGAAIAIAAAASGWWPLARAGWARVRPPPQ